MKTINERAYDAVGHPIHKGGKTPGKLSFAEQVFINGYIKGATDQKEIDNEEWQSLRFALEDTRKVIKQKNITLTPQD